MVEALPYIYLIAVVSFELPMLTKLCRFLLYTLHKHHLWR